MPVQRILLHVLSEEQRLAAAIHISKVLDRSSGAVAHLDAQFAAGFREAANLLPKQGQLANEFGNFVVSQQHHRVQIFSERYFPLAGGRIAKPGPCFLHAMPEFRRESCRRQTEITVSFGRKADDPKQFRVARSMTALGLGVLLACRGDLLSSEFVKELLGLRLLLSLEGQKEVYFRVAAVRFSDVALQPRQFLG